MKILVIGSKGFIGSSICKFYSENDSVELWQCDVFENTDNDPRYFSINSSDINFENIFRLQSFDICINAAGSGNVGLSFDNPLYDFESNTYGVIKILEAIRMLDSKCRFINFSSAAVYGDPKNLPIRENSEIKPLSPYGFNKAMAEHICKEYFAFFGIKTCNLRVFSAYGPGLKKQIFWDIYQKFKLAKNEIEMFGTGEETRDFIYIDDLVNAIDIIINKSPFQGECINVASGSEVNIADA